MEYSVKLSLNDIKLKSLFGGIITVPERYYYLTCHREENTNKEEALLEIFKAMESLDAAAVYPVHPRNKERAKRLVTENGLKNIIICKPVGYLESTALVRNAVKIVTDSGGLQREAFFAKKKCVTVLDFIVWPETMIDNRNQLSKPDAEEILMRLQTVQYIGQEKQPFGDGHSALKIVKAMENYKA